MKKVLSLILALVMLVSVTAVVSAEELPEEYLVYQIEGMQRVLASSSIIENDASADSGLLFDHLPGTSLTFDFTDKETKSVTLLIGSRDHEKVEKLAFLIDHDEETAVAVSLYVTNDPDFKTWMPVNLYNEKAESEETDDNENDDMVEANEEGWKVLDVDELNQGFAFYRIDFKMKSGDAFTLKEVALFRTEEAEAPAENPTEEQPSVSAPKTIIEKEPWRKVLAFRFGRLF